MSDPTVDPVAEVAQPMPEPARMQPPMEFWEHVRTHKIAQWSIAYLGAALALAQGQEFIAHAFEWPPSIGRVLVIALIVGLPIAVTLAWYHGHRGLRSISAGELTIISLLMLIGAVFFTVAIQPPSVENAAAATAAQPVVAPPIRQPATETRAQPALPNLIAVLPLSNLSPDPANAFYANGMHAEIISQLTKVRSLNVIPRDEVMRYTVDRPPLETIATETRAQALLTGTFQFANGQIRVQMQLVDSATRVNLWGDQYQGPFAEIFAVQADIATKVANALDAEYSVAEQERIEKVPTKSLTSYALYLEARSARFEDRNSTRALELIDEAIAIDPEFALGSAARASVLASSIINTLSSTAWATWADVHARVVADAERALELDPGLAHAHAVLGAMYQVTWRWREAQQAFDHAYELNPSAAEVMELYSQFLSYSGAHADAIRVADRRVRLQPGNVDALLWLHVAHAYAKDPESGVACRQVIARVPNHLFCHYGLGLTLARAGDGAAEAEFQLTERLFGANRPVALLAGLAVGYSQIGRTEDVARLQAEVEALGRQVEVGAGVYAALYLATRDREKLATWLKAAAEKARRQEPDPGFIDLMNIRHNVFALPLLEESRFRELRAQLGTL